MTPRRYQKLRRVLAARQADLTVLLDRVHKPHNIAAVVRTCDAVGIPHVHVVAPDGDIDRHHGISGGSRKWVELRLHPSLGDAVTELKRDGLQVVAAHPGEHSVDFRAVDYTRPTAVLMGTELWGVSEEGLALADRHISVPMHGMVASLNVSVAAAVILYEAQRQREAAGLYAAQDRPDEAQQRTLFETAYPRVARRCRELGLSYPPLTEDGSLPAGWRVDAAGG